MLPAPNKKNMGLDKSPGLLSDRRIRIIPTPPLIPYNLSCNFGHRGMKFFLLP